MHPVALFIICCDDSQLPAARPYLPHPSHLHHKILRPLHIAFHNYRRRCIGCQHRYRDSCYLDD
jgi:hypothetical protein